MSENQTCSFCGKETKNVRYMIEGPKVWICDECVWLCVDIIKTEDRKKAVIRSMTVRDCKT